jgi:hypothetical protein
VLHGQRRQQREAENGSGRDDREPRPVRASREWLACRREEDRRDRTGDNGAADADEIGIEPGESHAHHRQREPEDDDAAKTERKPLHFRARRRTAGRFPHRSLHLVPFRPAL